MSKRQKKKAHVAEGELDVEIITKEEYIHEDTRATTGVEPDYKWGEIYQMIANQNVRDAGFDELTIYANIEKSALMKVATRLELFPCLEVIGWILPREDMTTMSLENTAKQGYATYSPTYVSMEYHLPPAQIYLTASWMKETNLDLAEIVKRMMIPWKNFQTRPSGEYETTTLRTPYRFIALMLNRVFGRVHGKSFKLG